MNNPLFPTPLNTNRLAESDVKEMPPWFKIPLDFVNKIAETVYYAQESGFYQLILDTIAEEIADAINSIPGGGSVTNTPDWNSPSTTEAPSVSATKDRITDRINNNNIGKIVQILSVDKDDTFATSSTSFVDIPDLEIVITPASASSDVELTSKVSIGSDVANFLYLRFIRNGTPIGVGATAGSRTSATSAKHNGGSTTGFAITDLSPSFVDSPSTTSPVTYKIQMAVSSNNGVVNRTADDSNLASRPRTISTFTAKEILG